MAQQQPQQQKHALSDEQAAALARIVAQSGAYERIPIGDYLVGMGLATTYGRRHSHTVAAYYVPTPAGRRMDEARRAAAQKGVG